MEKSSIVSLPLRSVISICGRAAMTQQRSELGMYGRWQSAYLAYPKRKTMYPKRKTRPTKQNKELYCASLFNCIRDIDIYPENSSQIRNNGIMMLKMIQLQFTALSLSRMKTETTLATKVTVKTCRSAAAGSHPHLMLNP